MKTIATTLALLALAAVSWLCAPCPAQAGITDDVKALFATGEHQDDPFLPLHDLYKGQAQAAEARNDLPTALEYYTIAATIDRRDRVCIKAARALKAKLEALAAESFKKGLALLEAGDKDAAHAAFTAALHLNPDKKDALPYLKNAFGGEIIKDYEITQGDTLRRISEKVYGNPGGELLLTRINNLSIADALTPGETIKVPEVSAALSKRLHMAAVEPAKGASKGKQAITVLPTQTASAMPVEEDITASEAQSTGALLAMAKLQFGNGLYGTAVSMAEEILAKNPANQAASAIRNDSYYNMADKSWEDGSAAEAMRMLVRLPKGFKDSDALKKTVQAKLDADSEPLYLAGVKHFLAEDLDKAVEQWELTLQVNPYHAKARQDLEKARQLMEAVKGF
ncbi:LysM peptidoglycan-binding domain-containing protein [Desulfocurvus sp. DL9XJH121]